MQEHLAHAPAQTMEYWHRWHSSHLAGRRARAVLCRAHRAQPRYQKRPQAHRAPCQPLFVAPHYATVPPSPITKDHTNKPYLSNQLCFFSISHSWPYIAVIIDTLHETGIDIQTYHPRITDIRHKFLSPSEQTLIGDDPQLITLAWCAKESVYKWYGSRKVDFIAHLPITSLDLSTPDINMSINFNINELTNKILLHNLITTDFACSYISDIV